MQPFLLRILPFLVLRYITSICNLVTGIRYHFQRRSGSLSPKFNNLRCMLMREQFRDQSLITWSVGVPYGSCYLLGPYYLCWHLWNSSWNVKRSFTYFFCAMQIKEKEKTYKRLREENEFAQKVHIFLAPQMNSEPAFADWLMQSISEDWGRESPEAAEEIHGAPRTASPEVRQTVPTTEVSKKN